MIKKYIIVVFFLFSLVSTLKIQTLGKTIEIQREIRYTEIVKSEEICSNWKIIKEDFYHWSVCGQDNKTLDSSVVWIYLDSALIIRQTIDIDPYDLCHDSAGY